MDMADRSSSQDRPRDGADDGVVTWFLTDIITSPLSELSSGTTLVPSQKHVHISGSHANPTLSSDTIVLLHTQDENVIVLRIETNTD